MAKTSSRKRSKPKDSKHRGKKKVSVLTPEQAIYLDYKDTDLLKRFMSDRAKIRGRRVSGNDPQQQRVVARAIKNAREMGLLAYTNRVTTQRRGGGGRGGRDGGGRDGGGRGDRGDRGPREDRGPRPEGNDNAEAKTSSENTEVATEVTTQGGES